MSRYLVLVLRGLGWHFDRSAFSVNLILRECPRGQGTWPPGAFMYIPDAWRHYALKATVEVVEQDGGRCQVLLG